MPNPFVRRLQRGASLTEAECGVLADLTRHVRHAPERWPLVHAGDPLPQPLVVLDGWACRWKAVPCGRRQITDLLLPGDASHIDAGLLAHADHAVSTLSRCAVAELHPVELADALERWPGVARALRWSALQTDSILREALLNNSRRLAGPRLAHQICEVVARLRSAGLPTDGTDLAWPITQEEFAELTGLTSVHVNRSLQALRAEGLLSGTRRLAIADLGRLTAHGKFQGDYLHFLSDPPA